MNCRHCSEPLHHTFIDLGFAPPSNAYLKVEDLHRPEKYFPLRIKVCDNCWLVQTEDYSEANELFNDEYAYFSSTSSSWLAHARQYCELMIKALGLGLHSQVIEVASNDGYLLKNFLAQDVPCLGIEPTLSTASAAEELGIPVIREFFGEKLGQRLVAEGLTADLIVGNNVYAHVPDINDFTRGLCVALKPEGVVTLEFPHLMQLIDYTQFDTIYHEHYSYLSLTVVQRVFETAGLRVWDVEELTTHGGSLRVFGCRKEASWEVSSRVAEMLSREVAAGIKTLSTYTSFQSRADKVKNDLLIWLIEQKQSGKQVAAYGAAAKGNTLLNYAGVKTDLLSYVCDAATAKQGKYLPGSHIMILPPEALRANPPDIVLILPWNISQEVQDQLEDLAAKGVSFAVAIPRMALIST